MIGNLTIYEQKDDLKRRNTIEKERYTLDIY